MFSGRNLDLWLGARGHGYVEVDIRPDEAIDLLDRLQNIRRKADRDERLAFWVYEDRDYRIGWDRSVEEVELQVRPEGLAWRFRVSSDDGPVWIHTEILERERLLAAMLATARPEPFRGRFQSFAKRHPRSALKALEEWLDLDMPGSKSPAEVVPLTEEDLVPILDSDDPDIRDRARPLPPRLSPDDSTETKADAA